MTETKLAILIVCMEICEKYVDKLLSYMIVK